MKYVSEFSGVLGRGGGGGGALRLNLLQSLDFRLRFEEEGITVDEVRMGARESEKVIERERKCL